MQVEPAALPGVVLVRLAPQRDPRGSFTRVFDEDAFAAHGLVTAYLQAGEARNASRGTLRGLHFQNEPHAETKCIRCVTGALWDVLVDLRPASPTYGRWQGFELDADEPALLYVPAGFAHGYQTLRDETVVSYLLSARYAPASASGIHYASPALAIPWPIADPIVSERDRALPAFAAPAFSRG